MLESAYGTGPLNPGHGTGSVYQPQVMDDYGDPGYSDPSYEGPSHGGSGGPAYPARSGFHGGDGRRGRRQRIPAPRGAPGPGNPLVRLSGPVVRR